MLLAFRLIMVSTLGRRFVPSNYRSQRPNRVEQTIYTTNPIKGYNRRFRKVVKINLLLRRPAKSCSRDRCPTFAGGQSVQTLLKPLKFQRKKRRWRTVTAGHPVSGGWRKVLPDLHPAKPRPGRSSAQARPYRLTGRSGGCRRAIPIFFPTKPHLSGWSSGSNSGPRPVRPPAVNAARAALPSDTCRSPPDRARFPADS